MNDVDFIISILQFVIGICGWFVIFNRGNRGNSQKSVKERSIGTLLLIGSVISVSARNWGAYLSVAVVLLFMLLLIHTLATKFKSKTTKHVAAVLWLILMLTVVSREYLRHSIFYGD